MRRLIATLALCGALALALAAGCSKREGAGPKKGGGGRGEIAFPVEVQRVAAVPVEYAVTAVGSVEAFEHVQVVARVAGAVERVHFKEGDVVEKGTLLVEIDPDRFQLALASARADLARARAARLEAARGLERREMMKNEGIVSAEEVDTYRTRATTSSAAEAQASAALSLAELNLRESQVRAPVDGTLQTRTIRTGEYVQVGAPMATLVRRDPLLLRFKVAEHEAIHLRRGKTARFTVRGVEGTMTAKLTHVADVADVASRMVAIVGEIEPPTDALRPGAFAEVVVPVGKTIEAPVVPQTAVRPSEKGFLAYVVEGERAAERVLELGLRTQDGLVEVKRGLAAGELLVVRGAEALRDGARVRPTDAPADAAASGAPATPPPGAGADASTAP